MTDKQLDPIEALKAAKGSADLQAPSVILSDGDYLVGTIATFSTGWSNEKDDAGKIQGEYPIVLLEVEEASIADKDMAFAVKGVEVAVHVFHRVLRSQMMKADVRPGLRIAIRRFGDVKAKHGTRTYADWGVVRSDQGESSAQAFNERFGR